MAEAFADRKERRQRLGTLFTSYGPPIGAIWLGIYFAWQFGYDSSPLTGSERLFDQLKLFGVILVLAYLVGALPAYLAGIGAGYVADRKGGTPLWQALLIAQAATMLSVLALYTWS